MIASMFKDFIFYTLLSFPDEAEEPTAWSESVFWFYFGDCDLIFILLCTELGWFAENLPIY